MKNKFSISIYIIIFLSSCDYSTETYKEGKVSYELQCAPCHGMNSEGLGTLYPTLLHIDFLKTNREHIPCWIHNGIGSENSNEKPTRFSDQAMPAIDKLSAIEICNVLNYLNARYWKTKPFTIQEINEQLAACKNAKNETTQPMKVK